MHLHGEKLCELHRGPRGFRGPRGCEGECCSDPIKVSSGCNSAPNYSSITRTPPPDSENIYFYSFGNNFICTGYLITTTTILGTQAFSIDRSELKGLPSQGAGSRPPMIPTSSSGEDNINVEDAYNELLSRRKMDISKNPPQNM